MKMHLLLTLAGLAIGFVVPAFAQQTRQIHNYVRSLSRPSKNIPMRSTRTMQPPLAANFTEDGILVTPGGPISGREAIEKHYADDFKQGFHSSNNIATPDEDSPHMIGTASNEMWATGRWSATIQGKDWGPIPATGYWSVIREGDDWMIRMLAFNVTPPPAATPSPPASPSNK
jgi:hypothetical protein